MGLDRLSHGVSIVIYRPPFGFETNKIKSPKIRGLKKIVSALLNSHPSMCN
jgi:hypothetical protein